MKILLIENDADHSNRLRQLLDGQQHTLDVITDGFVGFSTALHTRYDLILLDALLPRLDGLELVRRLRQEGDTTPMLMISRLSEPADKVRGLYAGADDYVVKPGDPDELLARMYALYRRRTGGLNAPTILSVDNLELNMAEKAAYRANKRINLTAREFELLAFLIQNAGRTVTKTQILEKVWNARSGTNTNRVEVYINFLRRKIDRGFDQKLIHTAMGVGYLLRAGL